MITPRTKRLLFCISLINIAFFLYLFYIVWKEYDSFLFYETSLHAMTKVDADLLYTIGTGIDKIPIFQILIVDSIAKVASFIGCSYMLFGDHKRPTLPISRRAAVILIVLTWLANICYTHTIRVYFANTYCRAWMQLADDVLLPVLFIVLASYGWYQLRRSKKPFSETLD